MVDERHLELMLKIGKRPQSFDHHAAVLLARKLRQKLVGLHHRHIWKMLCDTANQLHALSGCKDRMLFRVDHHAHDQLVKAGGRPLDDV